MGEKVEVFFTSKVWLTPGAIFFGLFIIYSIFSFANGSLLALPDELIYWGHARYFAGGIHPHFFNAAYASFGYSLFLTPLFLLWQNAAHLYIAVIILNNVLVAASYFLLYYIIHNIYGADKRSSWGISLVSLLYPSFLIQTSFIMSENVFLPIFLLLVVILYKWTQQHSHLYSLLLSFTAVFLYAIHPRAMIIPFLILLFVGVFVILGRASKKSFLIALSGTILFTGLTFLINRHLVNIAWAGVQTYGIQRIWEGLSSGSGIFLFLSAIVGQFLYLVVGSLGLFLLGFYYLGKKIMVSGKFSLSGIFSDNQKIVILFIILSSLSILMISWATPIFANPQGSLRPDHIIYGRYNDAFAGFFIAAGLMAITGLAARKTAYFLLFFLLALPVDFVYQTLRGFNDVSTFNIWALTPFFSLLGNKSIILASLVSLTIFVILVLSARHNFRLTLLLLALVFIGFSFTNKQVLVGSRDHIYPADDSAMVHYLENTPDIKELSFDMSTIAKGGDDWSSWYLSAYHYQYYLPQIRFEQFDGSSAIVPRYKYVLSRSSWVQADTLAARIIFYDFQTGQSLWQIPE